MRRFTLCITSFALVLSLVVVTAVPAFADDSIQVQDGYNVECVPYSPYISSLIVTDNLKNNSVYYSSSNVRTYSSTASTFSFAPASTSSGSSTDYVYSYSNIADLFLYRSVNSAISYEFLSDGSFQINSVSDTLTSTKIVFTSRNLTSLKVGNKYSFSFRISFDRGYHSGNMIVRLYDSSDSSKYLDLYSSSGVLKVDKNISATLVVPDDWAGVPVLKMEINWTGISTYFPIKIGFQNFVMSDITNENLDNSLDKFGDRLENVLDPSEPYNSFNDGSFENSADELKNAENALPTVNHDAFQNLANSIDLSEYSNTFAAINNLFIRFVDTVGITPLIFFALFFGICIFILGRKLSGG